MTEKFYDEQIEGLIVNSVTGPHIDNTDPKNPILPEFVLKAVYDLAMLNKADIDGGGTTGGVWYQDTILSDLFPNYKQVIRVLGGQMAIEYGNVELDVHRFVVTSVSGLKVKVGSAEYTVFHNGNFNPDSKANTDGSNATGALATTIANNHNHTNKSVLDSITAQDLIDWDSASAQSHNALTLGANAVGIDLNTATQRLQFQNGYQLPTTIKLGEYDDAYLLRHSHGNKSVLDNLTQSVIDNAHTHGNKALLDSYNQTNANIADAVSLRHSHINKAILDAITAAYTTADKNTLDALAGIQLEADQANALIRIKDGNGNVLSTLNVAFLNNEGTTFIYNPTTNTLDLTNDYGQILSSIPVSSFVTNLVSNANWNGTTPTKLDFKDNAGTVLFSIDYTIANIQGLENALDTLTNNIGNLSSLTTTHKTDIVGAINEVNSKTSADFIKASPSAGIGNAFGFAIGSDANGTFLQSHNSKALHLNPEGNDVFIQGEKISASLIQLWNSYAGTFNLKANVDGSNTIGGSWKIDYILSDVLTGAIGNGQVLVPKADGTIDYGSTFLNSHRFQCSNVNGLKIGVDNVGTGDIWHQFNLENVSQLINDANYTTLPIVQTWVGTQGFLTSFTETDPTVPSHVKAITTGNITSWNAKQNQLTNGLHTTLSSNQVNVAFDVNTYVKDKSNNDRLLFGNTSSTDVVIHGAVANGDFKVKDNTGADMFRMNGSNKVPYFPQLPAPQTMDGNLAIFDTGDGLWKHSTKISDLVTQAYLTTQLNFKANTVGNNLSNIPQWKTNLGFLDSSDLIGYATETWANGRFSLLGHTHPISDIIGLQNALDGKANTNGSNTTGGSWKIDYILSDVLTGAIGNGQVLVPKADGTIDYGSTFLNSHRFQCSNVNGLKIGVDNVGTGDIWHQFNFNPANYALLSQVYTQAQVNTLLNDKVDKVAGKQLSTEDYTSAEKTKLADIQAGATVPNNGTFTVQGDGVDIIGSGSTSADASANTLSTLSLSAAVKSDIEQGIEANLVIPSIIDGVDYQQVNSTAPYNVTIYKKKTIVNVTSGLLGGVINVDNGLYDGYELAINGCDEWHVELRGNIQNRCRIQGGTSINGSVLFWWSAEMGMWVQAT